MTLTGWERGRDLEMLHYLATHGEMDEGTCYAKWRFNGAPAIYAMRNMGHPIRVERSPRGFRRYLWIPSQ